MKKFLTLLFVAGLMGCTSSELIEEEEAGVVKGRPSDGAGFTGGGAFVREGDALSEHQQYIGGGL